MSAKMTDKIKRFSHWNIILKLKWHKSVIVRQLLRFARQAGGQRIFSRTRSRNNGRFLNTTLILHKFSDQFLHFVRFSLQDPISEVILFLIPIRNREKLRYIIPIQSKNLSSTVQSIFALDLKDHLLYFCTIKNELWYFTFWNVISHDNPSWETKLLIPWLPPFRLYIVHH